VFDGKFDQDRSGDEPTPSQVKAAVSAVPKLLVNENVPPEEVCAPLPPLPPLPPQAIKDVIRTLVIKANAKFLDFINHSNRFFSELFLRVFIF
jgi:hypothetical protein